MSKLQKAMLGLSCIFFAVTIYSLFSFEIYLIVLFLLLHSLCLIYFSFSTFFMVSRDERFMQTYHQDVGVEMAEKEKEIADLTERMEGRESELADIKSERDRLLKENESVKQSISELKQKNEDYEDKIKKYQESPENDVKGLLPHLSAEDDGRETVNIIAIAKQAADELSESARAASLHVSISSQSDTLLVRADRNRIITLFRNIIDNSIKYMRRAGSLVITISTIGEDIFIVLKDTGEGLSEDETKHIFELNYQGSNRISGNGLGLAQARAIVESYGGTIYAKSNEGKGMGVYIQLPA